MNRQAARFKAFLSRACLGSMIVVVTAAMACSTQPLLAQALEAVPWHLTQRDFHSQTWESSTVLVDPSSGKTIVQPHSFLELGSGLNFLDEAQNWQSSRAEFQITPDGGYAVAQFGAAKLIVENNPNSATALDFLSTIDNVRLKMGPLAVAWFDPINSTNLTVGLIADCAAELTAPNEITYKNCFQGPNLRASIRVNYRKSGVTQDLLVHEITDPGAFDLSKFCRLELYSGLTPDSAVPVHTTRVIDKE